jgi:hypothetical protein
MCWTGCLWEFLPVYTDVDMLASEICVGSPTQIHNYRLKQVFDLRDHHASQIVKYWKDISTKAVYLQIVESALGKSAISNI